MHGGLRGGGSQENSSILGGSNVLQDGGVCALGHLLQTVRYLKINNISLGPTTIGGLALSHTKRDTALHVNPLV